MKRLFYAKKKLGGTKTAIKISEITMSAHMSLYKMCRSLKISQPESTVIITEDCLITVMSVTSLCGFALASNKSLSPMMSDRLIKGIQKLVFKHLMEIFSLRTRREMP